MKYSDDFYDHFTELIQTEDQLFPRTREKLDEQITFCNRALISAAEDNMKPRERIDRTFKTTYKIKEKYNKRDDLNNEKRYKEAITLTKQIRKDIRKSQERSEIR